MMPEDVAIMIDGGRWRAWDSVEIRRSLDSFTSVTFESPFEPERREFRDTFRPFSFKDLDVLVGRQTLFTGTLVDVDPSREPGDRTVRASGYSRPAVLQEVVARASEFPLEFNDMKLSAIARRLAEPFGLTVEVDGPEGAPFRRVAARPDQIIYDFLADLAKQRGFVISDTPTGALLLLRSRRAAPVATLVEGEVPLSSITPSFRPRSYFSEITGIAKTRSGRAGSKHTVRNPWLTDVLRPHTFQVDDTDDADVPAATRAKMGRMFGNMLVVTVELPTWRDPRGRLWEPNTTVTLEAPGAMIYRNTDFIIRDVSLQQDGSTEGAALDLVLPGAFSGEIPEILPWA